MSLETYQTVGQLFAGLSEYPDVFWEVNLQIAQHQDAFHTADIVPRLYISHLGDLLVVPSMEVVVSYAQKWQYAWLRRLFFVPPTPMYTLCADWPMVRELLGMHLQAGTDGRLLTYDVVHDRAVATTASPDPEGSTYGPAMQMGYIHITYPSEQSQALLGFFGRA